MSPSKENIMIRRPGLGKRGTIDHNAKVFHAVQRTTMRLPLLESDRVHEYRSRNLRRYCMEENVTILCDILMSNHSHTILYADDPSRILSVFKRLNTGLSKFVWDNVISGSEYEFQFNDYMPYRLFSSSVRLFPVAGIIPLLIDTRYLYENPRHHGSSKYGLSYAHSSFHQMANGELSKREYALFSSLYGMGPKQVMKMITKPLQDFRDALNMVASTVDKNVEQRLFLVDSKVSQPKSISEIQNLYREFDT